MGDPAAVNLGEVKSAPRSDDDLSLEHFAFYANNAEPFEARLKPQRVRYKKVGVHSNDTLLVNLWDPDGHHAHVDFRLHEVMRFSVVKAEVKGDE